MLAMMYLKQKRCRRIKARRCADVFLTTVINAQEQRQVMMIDIPGAFMHVNINELLHVRLEGPMAELLTRVDPDKYRTYLSKESGKDVLYILSLIHI